jgi:peroxiredoxin
LLRRFYPPSKGNFFAQYQNDCSGIDDWNSRQKQQKWRSEMGLKESLKEFEDGVKSSMPQEFLNILNQGIDDLTAGGLEESAVKEGDKMPSFELKNALGELVSSDELLKKGPLVISFYRGGWCPFCNLELRALQSVLPDIESEGGVLVAISPELPDNSLSTSEKNELTFPVLSDLNNGVARQFGIVFELPEAVEDLYKNKFGVDLPALNGTEKFELPVPATFVAGTGGIIKYANVNVNYMQRTEPADVVAALKSA